MAYGMTVSAPNGRYLIDTRGNTMCPRIRYYRVVNKNETGNEHVPPDGVPKLRVFSMPVYEGPGRINSGSWETNLSRSADLVRIPHSVYYEDEHIIWEPPDVPIEWMADQSVILAVGHMGED